jgi:hypothetical protein
MMGKSWYKQFGYDFPCSCAEKAREEEDERRRPKPRGVIQNCCYNCDEPTTNKITVNKGKKNEREDFFCELCIIDCNKSAPVNPNEDEEFEAQVSNSHLLEVFGDEIVYNKLKELAEQPDLSSTLRVVWKFGDERLSLYVYIDGEPFFDAVYPRNHSCDMFYMLDELKKEQEE